MLVENSQPLDRRRPRRFNVAAVLSLLLVVAATATFGGTADEPRPPAPGDGAEDAKANGGERKQDADKKTPAVAVRKENLRYSGRSFDSWRDQLLNDLDPGTCVRAMDPIAAFGKMGYADEAIAALSEVLRADRAVENGGVVSQHAAEALAKIGAAAAPTLVEGLVDRREFVRYSCARAVRQLGTDGKSATDALVKLLADENRTFRVVAVESLVAVAVDNDDLRPTFEQLAQSDEVEIRRSFATSVSAHPPRGGWWVKLFVQLADDDDTTVRAVVGSMLAKRGSSEKHVIDAVEQLICDNDFQVTNSTTVTVAQGGNTALLAAVLTDAFESRNLWNHFSQRGQLAYAIDSLASAPDEAAATVPLLTKIVDLKAPSWQQKDELAAIDALGRLGPAAKPAIPALKRCVARDELAEHDPLRKHALRALQKIRGSDDAPADDAQ